MHAWRAASAAPPLSVTQLAIDGRRVRFLLTALAALMFTVHLFGVHVGHGEDASPPPTDQSSPSQFDAHGPATEPAAELAPVDAGSTSGDQAQVGDTHDEPSCGEAGPRGSGPPGLICPALRLLWQLEPLDRIYLPPTGPEPPRRVPSLVHELGVQRV